MMVKDIDNLLDVFFGSGNLISLQQIEDENAKKELKEWIKRFKTKKPTVLPRRTYEGLTWYGFAFTESQARKLSTELKAFIGYTYSDFTGLRAKLKPSDPLEGPLASYSNLIVFKFDNHDGVWARLKLLKILWEEKPELEQEQVKSVGSLLRDFHIAIQAGNRYSAEKKLRRLAEHHLLDPLNISFLRIQLLSYLRLWEEIFKMDTFDDLIQVRRPLPVTEALIKTIYYKHLSIFEGVETNYNAAINEFKNEVIPRYQNLFKYRATMQDPVVLKCFMLFAVVSNPPRTDLCDEILRLEVESAEDREFLENLASMLKEEDRNEFGRPGQLALRAFYRGEYDLAVQKALISKPNLSIVRVLFECAYEMQAVSLKRQALATLLKLSEEDKTKFFESRRNLELYEEFTGQDIKFLPANIEALIPSDWCQWLERLNRFGYWKRALEIAEEGANEWEVESFLSQPGITEKLCEQLNVTRDEQAEKLLLEALPHLLFYLQKDERWPRRALLPLYKIILDLLIISGHGGEDDLNLVNELTSVLLSLGLSENEYKELVDNARDLWDRYKSLVTLNWILDFLDLLVVYPCADEKIRLNLFQYVLSSINTFTRQIEESQFKLIKQIASDFQHEEDYPLVVSELIGISQQGNNVYEDSSLESAKELLKGKKLAIYIYSEPIAKRVSELIVNWIGNDISVDVSWDRAGNDRLKQMARNADIFIVNWSCAKHAATEFIEKYRPVDKPIIWVRGKGSSSIINSIVDYLTTVV